MLVDCQTCPVRDVHCADCMVTALSGLPIVVRPGPTRPAAAAGWQGVARVETLIEAGTGRVTETGSGRGSDPATVPLDRAERRAVSAFLAAGLITTPAANAARARIEVLPEGCTATRRAV